MLHAFEVPIARGEVGHELSADTVVKDIDLALRRSCTLFLGIQESGQLLHAASTDYPDIVKEVLRSIPAQNIAAILRNLVDEEVSIRNLRGILEALVQAAQHEKDIGNLTEFARMAPGSANLLPVRPGGQHAGDRSRLLPSEDHLLKSIRTGNGVQQLSLDPRLADRLRHALLSAIEEHGPVALLTNVQLRRHVRAMIVRDRFDVPVLSYNELVATLDLDVVHQVVVGNRRQARHRMITPLSYFPPLEHRCHEGSLGTRVRAHAHRCCY